MCVCEEGKEQRWQGRKEYDTARAGEKEVDSWVES